MPLCLFFPQGICEQEKVNAQGKGFHLLALNDMVIFTVNFFIK